MTSSLEGIAWAAAAVLVAAALYEALVALGEIPLGDEPGADARFADLALLAGLLASLVGAVAACLRAAEAEPAGGWAWIVLAPAGFALLLARWLTFDPYYLPSQRRYAEGEIHEAWIAVVGLAALFAAVAARRFPRVGSLAVAAALLVSGVTTWLLPIGK